MIHACENERLNFITDVLMADPKIYSMHIRQAEKSDLEQIFEVVEQVFKQLNEAILVDRLIEMNLDIPELSLVAELDGTIVGHILMSVATLDNDPEKPVIALAPLAVLPAHQRKGIGSELCIKSLELAKATDYGAVISTIRASALKQRQNTAFFRNSQCLTKSLWSTDCRSSTKI